VGGRFLTEVELDEIIDDAEHRGWLRGVAEKVIDDWLAKAALESLNLHELTEAALKIYRAMAPNPEPLQPDPEDDYRLVRMWAHDHPNSDPRGLAESLRYRRRLEESGRRCKDAERARSEARRLEEAERAIHLKKLKEDIEAWAVEAPRTPDPERDHPYGFERGYLSPDDIRFLFGKESLAPHLARWRLMCFIDRLIDIAENAGPELESLAFTIADVAAYHYGISMDECEEITSQVFKYCLRTKETCKKCDHPTDWNHRCIPKECPPELAHLLGIPVRERRRQKRTQKRAAVQALADAQWEAD
jgi:hypothetical protein